MNAQEKALRRLPSPPHYCSAEACEAWRQLAPALWSQGVVSPEQQHQLAEVCTCIARLRSGHHAGYYRRRLEVLGEILGIAHLIGA